MRAKRVCPPVLTDMLSRLLAALFFLSPCPSVIALDLRWPTPAATSNTWRPSEQVLQPTVSGEIDSAKFGCVRSNGYRFHEGIDIKPMKRDRRGEALDEISAAMDGVVRHINLRAGESSYGRYVVLEHPDQSPAVYTLYAHLSRVRPGLKSGDRVAAGEVLGTMGRSAGGYAIPRDRSHLHFEIGLYLSRNFQSWYAWKKFGSPNQHGNYNGMNLLGIDPLEVFRTNLDGRLRSFDDYFSSMESCVRLRVATTQTPDFIQRYPSLLDGGTKPALVAGWELELNSTGLPFRWRALSPTEVIGMKLGEVRILATDDNQLRRNRCRDLVDTKRGRKVPGPELRTVLELLFNLR